MEGLFEKKEEEENLEEVSVEKTEIYSVKENKQQLTEAFWNYGCDFALTEIVLLKFVLYFFI